MVIAVIAVRVMTLCSDLELLENGKDVDSWFFVEDFSSGADGERIAIERRSASPNCTLAARPIAQVG